MKKNFKSRLFIFNFAALIVFSFSSCYQLFQGKIDMIPGKTAAPTLSDIVRESEKITQLNKPEQVFVSKALYANYIKVSWTSVKGASSYRLERAVKDATDPTVPDESDYEVIKATATTLADSSSIQGTNYSDLIIRDPVYSSEEYSKVYYYRISAENASAGYDSSEYAYSEKADLFKAPNNVQATAGESEDSVTITWAPSSNAVRYKVFRSNDELNATKTLIGTVSGNVRYFKNSISQENQGINYYYSVVAVNSNAQESVSSAISLGYALKGGAPQRVQNVNTSEGRGNSEKSIKINWDPVTGIGIKYTIFRSSSVDSSLTQIATAVSTTDYEDKKNLKPNIYYYYRVLAYKEETTGEGIVQNKGPLSKSGPEDEKPCEGFILSAPETISINKTGTTCSIVFSATIGEEGFAGDSKLSSTYNTYSYKIHGADTKAELDTLSDGNLVDTLSGLTPITGYYSVNNIPQKKYYKIQTVNGSKSSNPSDIAAPSPFAAVNADASRHAYIEGVTTDDSLANKNGVFPVKVSWREPEGGADGGYLVYRSTKPDSGFRKITEEPVKQTFFIDVNETAKASTMYFYKVLSLNDLGGGTNYTEVKRGYGALTHDQFMREYNKTIQRSQKKLYFRNRPGDTDKLGTETINGDIQGTLYYSASIAGLGARIIMLYTDYVDFYAANNPEYGFHFHIRGNTNTSAEMTSNGTMDGTVVCEADGMYPGTIGYDSIKIVSGNAGGGYYVITPEGFPSGNVNYTVGNEGW